MTESVLDSDRARAELYEVMHRDLSFEEKVSRALDIGKAYLDVENGHLTRIDEETDYWEAIASTDPPEGPYPAGLVLDYQTTYCRRTVAEGTSIAVHDAPNQGWADDPAFETHGLACYHGTPITVDGDLFGTLCFIAEDPHRKSFDDDQTMFAELIARMIEHELRHTRQQHELVMKAGMVTVLNRVLRHNIRNDLNIIRGHLGLIAERVPEARDLYETARNKIDDIVALAETARDLESIAESEFDRQPVEVTRLVREIVDDLRGEYPAATITVDCPETVMLEASPTLRIALSQVIENAAKHAGSTPTVTVRIRETSDGARIAVVDDGPGLPEGEQAVLDKGIEHPLVHGSGLGLWLTYWIVTNHDGSIEPIVTDEGTEIRITLPKGDIPADVTDHDSLLRMFHREQDRFEAVFEESFDAMVIADDDGRYIEVNDRATELFGLPKEDLLGRRIEDFAPAEFDFQRAWQAFQASNRDRGTFPLVRADGEHRLVEYSASVNIIPGQHLSVLRDVTEREERRRRYQTIVDNLAQFTGLLSPGGTVLEANRSALKFGRLDRDDVTGRQLWTTDWFRGLAASRELVRDAVERAADGEFVRADLEIRGVDETVVVDFSVRPIVDDGDVVYLLFEGRGCSDEIAPSEFGSTP